MNNLNDDIGEVVQDGQLGNRTTFISTEGPAEDTKRSVVGYAKGKKTAVIDRYGSNKADDND